MKFININGNRINLSLVDNVEIQDPIIKNSYKKIDGEYASFKMASGKVIDVEISEAELDRLLGIKKESKPRTKFVKPTLEDVETYRQEKKLAFNPTAFINFYESNGWKVGKNPMKDWKAACRKWHSDIDKRFHKKTDGNMQAAQGFLGDM